MARSLFDGIDITPKCRLVSCGVVTSEVTTAQRKEGGGTTAGWPSAGIGYIRIEPENSPPRWRRVRASERDQGQGPSEKAGQLAPRARRIKSRQRRPHHGGPASCAKCRTGAPLRNIPSPSSTNTPGRGTSKGDIMSLSNANVTSREPLVRVARPHLPPSMSLRTLSLTAYEA